jgi:UDP-glucose 4-epimerase
LVKDIKPAIVYHLAAQVSVSRSIQNPYHDVDVNVLGTINLLEACVQNGVKRVVFSSSAAVYGMPQVLPIAENQILNPVSPYGASKASAEKYLQLFGDIYGLEYAILRYSNVYGPRQDREGEGGVVSVFHDRIQQNLPLYIYGSGEQTRDFIYVQDVVTANITALNCPANIICNVSTECRTSINKLAKLMAGDKPLEIQYRPARSGDILHSVLCNKQFKTITGLTPVFSIEQGLEDMRISLEASA